MAGALPLRDVHLPAAPGWWPPAPGWWLACAMAAVIVALIVVTRLRRKYRRARWMRLFDARLAAATRPAARIGAASELLRRAARRCDRQAALRQGESWLRFLDGERGHDFSQGSGHLLLDGGFRREVDATQAAQACALARGRFVELMERRR